jgi:hypothetical protein
VPLKATADAPVKFVPVIVTDVPDMPLVGLKLVMVGGEPAAASDRPPATSTAAAAKRLRRTRNRALDGRIALRPVPRRSPRDPGLRKRTKNANAPTSPTEPPVTNQRTLAESRQEGAARATNLHVRVGGRGKRRAACRLEDRSVERRLVGMGVRGATLPGGTVTFLFTDIEGSTPAAEAARGALRG